MKVGFLTRFVWLFFCVLGVVVSADAASVRVTWNANNENDLEGYRVYVGSAAGNYQFSSTFSSNGPAEISNLLPNTRYYFAVTAYDSSGNESARSNEVYSVAELSEGEVDTDGDGITDADELELGTNPNKADSDNDGVKDGQELHDGSKPLDQGSVRTVLSKKMCAEWNGFLDNLWNIMEVVNTSTKARTVLLTLYNNVGNAIAQSAMVVPALEQLDVLVHDHDGRERNSYGLVCLEHQGNAGDIDGRMVYYKGIPQPTTSSEQFQFAFAMPFSPGKRGVQVVPFNTYNPSFRASDTANLVANWIQITNVDSRTVNGTIKYFDMNGSLLGRHDVSIDPRARVDVAAHEVGPNNVGLVVWEPEKNDINVQVRNVRYVYDNTQYIDSFAAAFQLEALQGSGENLAVPFDTDSEMAVLEVFNGKASPVTLTVQVYSSSTRIENLTLSLDGYASRHIIINQIVGVSGAGVAIVRGVGSAARVGAVMMQYGRTEDGALSYMYGLGARGAIGTVHSGSFNTYLSQDSLLKVVNLSSRDQEVSLSLEARDTRQARSADRHAVMHHDVLAIRLNDYESVDRYGVATVQSLGTKPVVSWVLRKRGNEYVMPTPVR